MFDQLFERRAAVRRHLNSPLLHEHVEDFLQWFFRNNESLRHLTIADLDEAIARKGRDDGYARQTIQSYASDVRTFVRYAEGRGWCSQGLAAGIVSPRVYRGERLPR